MTLDPELQEIVVCPACRGRLLAEAESLTCQSCGRVYPVQDDIPVLLVEHARGGRGA